MAVLPWLAGGVAIHLLYQIALVAGYRAGDLTQVYPIARGSAPLIVLAVSVGVLGVTIEAVELAAVLTIATGIALLSLVRRADGSRNPRASVIALTIGCLIASYSLVDGIGARVGGTALGYWSWAALGNAVTFVLWIAATRPRVLQTVRRERELWRVGLFGGTVSFGAYAIAVWAFTQAPIALVSALRETSVVFALLIGALFLRERVGALKLLATVVTLGGAALLRLAA